MDWTKLYTNIIRTFSGISEYIAKLQPLYETGKIVIEDVQRIAGWLEANISEIKSIDVKAILDSLIKNGASNVYDEVVASMTFQEKLDFMRLSLDRLKEQNNKKYQQLAIIRTIAEIPEKLWPAIRLVF